MSVNIENNRQAHPLLKTEEGETRPGFLMIEVMLAITLFAMFASAAFLAFISGQQATRAGADRNEGLFYSEEGLEVAKAIRDGNFTLLTAGNHGFGLSSTGIWILSGSLNNGQHYDTDVEIHASSASERRIASRTKWKLNPTLSGETILTLGLTHWRTNNGIKDWSSASLAADVDVGSSFYFTGIAVKGDYLYLTSTSGGDGIYIYDVSNPYSPVRVSNTFTVSATARAPVTYKNVLYFLVEDGSNPEMHAYDISDPTNLTSFTTPMVTRDIAGGNNRGRSMYQHGGTLYVGANTSTSSDEFFSYDVTNTGAITLLDSEDITQDPTVFDVFVRSGFAYLGTSNNANEMTVYNVSDPSDLRVHTTFGAQGPGDAYGVRQAGTGYYLARELNGGKEIVMATGSGGHQSGSTYWYDTYYTVGSVDVDPVGCYSFWGTNDATDQFEIRDARNTTLPVQKAFTVSNGTGNVVRYDVHQDRVYVAAATGFSIYLPGTTSTCP